MTARADTRTPAKDRGCCRGPQLLMILSMRGRPAPPLDGRNAREEAAGDARRDERVAQLLVAVAEQAVDEDLRHTSSEVVRHAHSRFRSLLRINSWRTRSHSSPRPDRPPDRDGSLDRPRLDLDPPRISGTTRATSSPTSLLPSSVMECRSAGTGKVPPNGALELPAYRALPTTWQHRSPLARRAAAGWQR